MGIYENNRLVKAVQDKDVDEVIRLLGIISPCDVKLAHDNTILHLFCRTCRPFQKDYDRGRPIIAELIKKGADLNAVTDEGQTPLHVAAYFGCTVGAELLLENQAKMNEKDKWGQTPLHKAAYKHDVDITGLLLEKGASVNLVSNDGETPLETVAKYNHTVAAELKEEMKTLLLKHGAE